MDQVIGNKGRITILSLMLAGIVFSSVTLGFMMYVGDMQTQYSAQTTSYENNASKEAQDAVDRAGEISSNLKEGTEGTQLTGIDMVDTIIGSLFTTFKNLTTTMPKLFTGMITTVTSVIGLPSWVGGMITTIVITIAAFVIARMFLKSGRLGG